MAIEAIIFDLDGTVLDNEGLWEEAFVKVAVNSGFEKPKLTMPNGWWHEPGIGLSANWARFTLVKEEREELTLQTVSAYREISQAEGLRVTPGMLDVISWAREKGLMVGLATGSTWHSVEKELTELDLYLAFDVTTTGEEVIASKPDPEIYTLTMAKLGVEPKNCLVIEDAVAGVRAAKEAECMVLGLASGYSPSEVMSAAGAKWVVEEATEILGILEGEMGTTVGVS